MWGRFTLLILRRPDLLLAHLGAYRGQMREEWPSLRRYWRRRLVALIFSAMLLSISLGLLILAAMLDLAFPIQNRLWVYLLPASVFLLSLLIVLFLRFRSKYKKPSELRQQWQQDKALLQELLQRPTEPENKP